MLDPESPEFRIAHERLATAMAHRPGQDIENPDDPDTIQAMQLALHLPKHNPPARADLLAAAAQAVVAVCLDSLAGSDTAWAAALEHWYGHRIRKVARRARNTGWDAVQALPGVTSVVGDAAARAFIPSAVHAVPHLIRKLQINGTDVPGGIEKQAQRSLPTLYVDAGLGMSVGKTAAQVGHGSMLLAAAQPLTWVQEWARQGFALQVREVDSNTFAELVGAPDVVVIRDTGYTEVAPNSATVMAATAPLGV